MSCIDGLGGLLGRRVGLLLGSLLRCAGALGALGGRPLDGVALPLRRLALLLEPGGFALLLVLLLGVLDLAPVGGQLLLLLGPLPCRSLLGAADGDVGMALLDLPVALLYLFGESHFHSSVYLCRESLPAGAFILSSPSPGGRGGRPASSPPLRGLGKGCRGKALAWAMRRSTSIPAGRKAWRRMCLRK